LAKQRDRLRWSVVQPLIAEGKIYTRQIGRSAMWVVTRPCKLLRLDRWTILVPNVTSDVVMRLRELEPLIRQQEHILDDGYSRGELPELQDIFQTLIVLAREYGTITRISPKIKEHLSFEIRAMIARIDSSPVVKVATRTSILAALLQVAGEVERGNIRGTIANAIQAVFERLNVLGVIMPAIDHRRKDAFEALCQLERSLWLFAYKISTIRKALQDRHVKAGILAYLREMELPIFQPYRRNVTDAKRTMCLAIGAINQSRFETAAKLIARAIEKLGLNPIDLTRRQSID